ncbi:MAG TPA: thiol reductant ABC exporter subunit CydC [Streptosporangiaceae bacterium]|nr:thiol reductant ABC exporter subunit CydC [Streptosporangiaceae bacterium]
MNATVPQARHPSLPLVRLLSMARPLRGRLLLAVAAGAAATASGVALLAVSGFLIARASQHPNIVAVSIAVVAVRALGISRGVFRYTERLAAHDVAFRVLADVRVRIYQRLERLAPAGLAAFRSGDLLARLISDVDSTQDLFIRGIAPPAVALLVGSAATLAAAAILLPAGLVICAGLLLAGLAVPLIAAATARRSAAATAAARGQLGVVLTDLVNGADDLHAFGAAGTMLARAEHADGELTRRAARTATASAAGVALSSLAAGATLWAVLLLGVQATDAGTLGRVPLAVITLTALAAFEAVNSLPAAAIQLGQARAAAKRIGSVMDAPEPVREPADPLPLPAGPPHVRLRGATVRYGEGTLALDGVDLDLEPGKRVAIVGPSGAGKSTLAAVLLRFCDLTGGTVTLNGAPLASYLSADVRKVIGGCPQDPHIFSGTIAANLRLAKADATDRELADAARLARLLDWIESLPRKWDTEAGSHGARMSGGQRQRLAFARAVLVNPELMILDEPTAHLDEENRRGLMADLLSFTEGRSVLLITHELGDLEAFDEIILLRRGRVAERGTHAELLSSGGEYARLWRARITDVPCARAGSPGSARSDPRPA